MCIEKFLKTLELPKKYYDSDFDISEKYATELYRSGGQGQY